MRVTSTGVAVVVIAALLGVPALADITIPGLPVEVEGTDGDLVVTGYRVWHAQDLWLAPTGSWTDAGGDINGDGKGDGVYDPALNAVVFKYSSVELNTGGGTGGIYYHNHPSRAAVVWLVTGNVTIADGARIDVSGENAQGSARFSEPGPGGFRGGRGTVGVTPGSGGFGPGGGEFIQAIGAAAGSHSTLGGTESGATPAPTYGNAFILPLIGGSGAGTADSSRGGGAGGGAIMIVCTGTITVGGNGIDADGGDGNNYGNSGAGGAIRLIADVVTGDGPLRATSTTPYQGIRGGDGRIFVQANVISLGDPGSPTYVATDFNESPYYVWPPAETPTIRPTKIVANAIDYPIPLYPEASLDFPLADVSFDTQDPITLHIEAENVPTDWIVTVRVTPKSGDTYTVLAEPLTGDSTYSTTTATFSLNRGFGAIQVRAYQPPAGR